MVGEQTFEIVLHQSIKHPQQCRQTAKKQRQRAPLPGNCAEQIVAETDKTVNRDLEHYPRHQRRNVGGRRRMSLGQPDMQRYQPGLDAKTEKHQHKGQRGPGRAELSGTHTGEIKPATKGRQHPASQQNEHPAYLRHEQVDIGGIPVGGVLMLIGDQKITRQGHSFPADQKGEGIGRQEHQGHAGNKGAGKQGQG